MPNARIVGRPQAVAAGSQLRIAWDAGTERGAELPRAYFAAARVSSDRDVGPDGPPIDEAVTVTADREIVVTLRTNVDSLRGTVRFTLELPDRSQYVTCTKGSSPERYGLRVEAELGSGGAVTKATLTEIRPDGAD